MINIADYMGGDYVKGKHDCWTLMQDIFDEEHGIILPDFPIFGLNETEYAEYITDNMHAEKISEPEIGCIVHKSGIIEHVGYCVDGKHYLHRTLNETRCDRIKKHKCEFYRILQKN